MPYPKNIENKLAFNQITDLVSAKCLSPMGASYAQKVRFLNKFDLIERLLLQTKEFKRVLEERMPFPDQNYLDVGPWLYKARIEGIWLLEEELHQIRLTVQTFLYIAKFLRERNGLFPNLEALMEGLLINDLVIRRIDRILEPEGKLKANASPELSKLSQKINEKETEIRRKTQKLFDKFQDLGYLADNIGVSIREGRMVLPVLAEHKRHVHGFMHDESQTGQTVFIEPTECFELNNFLRELQLAFRRERERILLETTDQLRPEIPDLEKNQQRLGLFDFVRAKALLALEMKADMPLLSNHPSIHYIQAYHPLLKMSHDKLKLNTVPLAVTLTKESHIMVISGPNAGGKSVCLKTIGLLQYMLQCGFLIPCDSASEVGIFKEIMVDIGDEQSIENDLSTYSSHLLSMKNFTEFADAKNIFLIDEFGTGTDPQFGGPLAEAILHQLTRKNAFGVVTTHFSNLKNFANHTPGLLNACMLFDHEALQPLYILETGKPGSSYAFELAVKSGLNQHIINYAKNKVGDKQRKVEELLVELEREKQHVNELRKRFSEKEEKTDALLLKYESLTAKFEAEKKQMLKKAKEEAFALVSEANSKIEAAIREIKQEQASSEVQRKARTLIKEELQVLKQDVIVDEPSSNEGNPEYVLSAGQIQIGDIVKIAGQETPAKVLEIQKNKAVIGMGDLRSTVALNKLERLEKEQQGNKKQAPKGIDFNARMQHFSSELNVIGTRGEEALKQLDDYLDDALILGMKQVRIVHGKGYGILRKLIRNSLKMNKMVVTFQDEHIELGGDGVTIVTLKV